MKVWGFIKDGEKIIKSIVVEDNNFDECLLKICYEFDMGKPVWLNKHENEIKEFGRVVFKPADFIETTSFTSFELEIFKKTQNNRMPI